MELAPDHAGSEGLGMAAPPGHVAAAVGRVKAEQAHYHQHGVCVAVHFAFDFRLKF